MWSPCITYLRPPEMLGSHPLKSVPLPEACLLSLRQGRSASLPTWGKRPWVAGGFVTTPGPSLLLSAMVRCFLVVTAGQGTQLVHSTALQEITRLSRKSRGTLCHLPITQKVLDSLKGAAELWPESMKKDSCLLLPQAQGSGGEITGHSHPN